MKPAFWFNPRLCLSHTLGFMANSVASIARRPQLQHGEERTLVASIKYVRRYLVCCRCCKYHPRVTGVESEGQDLTTTRVSVHVQTTVC